MFATKMTQFDRTRYINKLLGVMTQVRMTLESVKSSDTNTRIDKTLQSIYTHLCEKIDAGLVTINTISDYIPAKLFLENTRGFAVDTELCQYHIALCNIRSKLCAL